MKERKKEWKWKKEVFFLNDEVKWSEMIKALRERDKDKLNIENFSLSTN